MHLYVPSLLLLTRASVRVPDGPVTNAFTLPPRGTTDRASTVNSVVDSRNTPAAHKPASSSSTLWVWLRTCSQHVDKSSVELWKTRLTGPKLNVVSVFKLSYAYALWEKSAAVQTSNIYGFSKIVLRSYMSLYQFTLNNIFISTSLRPTQHKIGITFNSTRATYSQYRPTVIYLTVII